MNSEKKTRQAFIWSSILEAPFWALYGMLIFILCKDLKAPVFQYTLLIALKPTVSLFTPFWSSLIYKRPDRLRSNVIAADLIAHAPFFLFPWLSNSWFLVAAGAIFLMMKRSVIPAWMEILKLNLPRTKRERTFSLGTTLSYVAGVLLPFAFGKYMDLSPGCWRYFFPLAALLSLCSTFFLLRIPLSQPPAEKPKITFLTPWRNTLSLLRKRPDFTRFQLGFMLGGGGLMIMQPALYAYIPKTLNLTYTEIAIAVATCKGIGFALTSRLWASWMPKSSIFRFSALVTFLAALFPLLLILAKFKLPWIFVAYLAYGVMQAGSKLSWNLSGPIFAREEDSTPYSSVNVVTVGLRGMVAPFIGSFICLATTPSTGLLAGGLFCLLASAQLLTSHYQQSPQPRANT